MAYTQITPEQIAKLPKGAQAHIKRLERQLEDLNAVIERITGPEDAAITVLQRAGYGSGETSIVQNIEAPYGVSFKLNGMEAITVREDEREGKKVLRLMADGHPSQLVFIPQVGNVCYVMVSK